MSLTHAFVSTKTDGNDATRLRPSNWNAEHVFGGGSDGQVLVRDSAQSTGWSWTAVRLHSTANAANTGQNTFLGVTAGNFTLGSATPGDDGSYLTGIGYGVLRNVTTGKYNVGVGAVFAQLTTGQWDTAVGSGALPIETTGNSNTAIGADTLYDSVGSSASTAVGHFALYGRDGLTNPGHTTITECTAVGYLALADILTGSYNTAVGSQAGYGNAGNGSTVYDDHMTFLGYQARRSPTVDWHTVLSYGTAIGAGTVVGQSNSIVLGRPDTDKIGIGTATPQQILDVYGGALFGSAAFSARVGINTDTAGTQSGGRVSVLSTASNDNLILNAKGSGNVIFNLDAASAGVLVYSSNKTLASDTANFTVRSSSAFAIDKGGALGLGGIYSSGGSLAEFAYVAGRKESATDGEYGGYLQFATRAYPSGAPTERLRITSAGVVRLASQPAFASGDKYLVIDASGNLHVSALGPAS